MDLSPPPRAPLDPGHVAPILAFLAGSAGVMFVTALATAGLAAAQVALTGGSFADFAADPQASMSTGVMGGGALVQMAGLLALAVVLARQFDERNQGLPAFVALDQPGSAPWLLAAGLGATTVGLLPGWLAARILDAAPELGVALQGIAEHLHRPDPFGKSVLLLAICVAAPIAEEVAFRGYLWRALEPVLPGWGVLLATTILFSAYHLDPVQSPSLVPTALFLGVLRWASGSAAPAVLAHAVNNGLAALSLVAAGDLAGEGVSLPVAAGGAAFTVACCTAAWSVSPPEAR